MKWFFGIFLVFALYVVYESGFFKEKGVEYNLDLTTPAPLPEKKEDSPDFLLRKGEFPSFPLSSLPIKSKEPVLKQKTRLSKAECARLINQRLEVSKISTTGKAVTSADYVPGVTTTGRAVVDADLENGFGRKPNVFDEMENLELSVTLDLEEGFPLMKSSLHMGKIPLATVKVADGKVTMDKAETSFPDFSTLPEECWSEDRSQKSKDGRF